MSDAAAPIPASTRPGALRPDVEHEESPRLSLNYGQLDESALALRKAWGIYLLMAILPPMVMILSIFYLIFTPLEWYDRRVIPLENTAGWVFFLLGMIWIAATVPISFYIRSRYWSAYYRDDVVSPGDYIKGNVAIWLPLVIAGVMGFIGFAATRYVANLFTSITAFMIFLTMFPNGHAMTRPIGDHDDPGVYEEPG
jgi:hypothetical protein